MRRYNQTAVEWAMKVQEIILRAIAKKITWIQAAVIIGISARQMRRWLRRYEEYGYDGLFDRRKGKQSPRKVPLREVEKILGLYRDEYFDLNVRHFHEKLVDKHGIKLSYTWVKAALQGAGFVKQGHKRGVHRKRRPRRPMVGMMLHIDGSKHQWFKDNRWHDLIVIMDDANSEIYYAQLVDEESTATVMAGLREVIEQKGIFCSMYSDRASHFFVTPKAGGRVDKDRPTQVARALKELGIELIAAYSPQARGRSERGFGTWQGRLPQELRLAKITTVEAANLFLRQTYIEVYNRKFSVKAAQPGSAFVPVKGKDLDLVFATRHDRVVGRDNIVSLANCCFQIERTKWKNTLAGCAVGVHELADGTITITYGSHVVGRYTAQGVALDSEQRKQAKVGPRTTSSTKLSGKRLTVS